jgi:prefoldin subunit 5
MSNKEEQIAQLKSENKQLRERISRLESSTGSLLKITQELARAHGSELDFDEGDEYLMDCAGSAYSSEVDH